MGGKGSGAVRVSFFFYTSYLLVFCMGFSATVNVESIKNTK